jgi:excisionase family DNA binding protein
MSYIGGLSKGELSAFLKDEILPFLKEIRELRAEVADLKARLNSNKRELYTIKDLTALFSVSAATIHNWINEGKLIKHKIGGRTQFKRVDVERLIELSKESK